MAAPTTWTVVRDILTANLALTADEVIAKAKAKGVKTPDDAIRTTVHTLRKRLKKKAAKPALAVNAAPSPKPTPTPKPAAAAGSGPPAKSVAAPVATPAPKPAPAAARQIPAASTSAVLRSILAADLALPADVVLARAKAKGVTVPDAKLRTQIHNLKSEIKGQAAKAAVGTPPAPSPKPAPPAAPTAPTDVPGVLANVTLVHAAVAACGGVGQARRVAEAVQACGGVGAFGQYLDLVAGIRDGTA